MASVCRVSGVVWVCEVATCVCGGGWVWLGCEGWQEGGGGGGGGVVGGSDGCAQGKT